MFEEHVREIDYMAQNAGIHASVDALSQMLRFKYISYNDKIEDYF